MRIYQARKRDYDAIQRGLKNPPPKLKASRILLSACQDDQHAMGYKDGGVFTVALLKVWNDGKFTGSYGDLARGIRDEIQRNYNHAVDRRGGDASKVRLQVPNFVQIKGSSQKALDELIGSRPFEI